MLEDKIIVQDRGFDAGLAALMQNANKGNMDPAALMAMMNNNGMGGNGCWWIWIILLFFVWGGWGGNGFGNRCGEASQLASQLNTDANTNLLMQAINGNKEAISTLSNTLNCDINSVQSALNTINTSVVGLLGGKLETRRSQNKRITRTSCRIKRINKASR